MAISSSLSFPRSTPSPLPAGWHHTQQPSLIGTTVLLLFLTNAAILLKISLRSRASKRLFSDDWCLLASLFLSDGLLSINFVAIKAGLGLHAARVLAQDPSPPNRFIIQAKVAWANSVVNPPALFLVKLAILLFIRRVFFSTKSRSYSTRSTSTTSTETLTEKKFPRPWRNDEPVTVKDFLQEKGGWLSAAWWVNLGYAVCMVIVTTIIFICQVRPIDFSWNELFFLLDIPSPKLRPAHIHVIKDPYVGTGVPEVLNEFSILFLAMAACYKLRTKMKNVRKTALLFIFILGLFVCCCGIPKIVYSYDARLDNDFSWNAATLVAWACAQVGVGQILACLPSIVVDIHILHFERKGYLTKLWPPHPIRMHMPDVFHFYNRPASSAVDGNGRPSFQPSSSLWSRFSLSATTSSNRKRSGRNPSLESDFEWVTVPRNRTNIASDSRAGTRSNQSFRVNEDGEIGEAYSHQMERSFFDDTSTATENSSADPQSRNVSVGSANEHVAMPSASCNAADDAKEHSQYPEML